MRVTFGDPLLVVTFVRGLLLMEQEMADGIPGKSQYLKKKKIKAGEREKQTILIYFIFMCLYFHLPTEKIFILKQVTLTECLLCARFSVCFKVETLGVIGQESH